LNPHLGMSTLCTPIHHNPRPQNKNAQLNPET
jgi:hypothetical protein